MCRLPPLHISFHDAHPPFPVFYDLVSQQTHHVEADASLLGSICPVERILNLSVVNPLHDGVTLVGLRRTNPDILTPVWAQTSPAWDLWTVVAVVRSSSSRQGAPFLCIGVRTVRTSSRSGKITLLYNIL